MISRIRALAMTGLLAATLQAGAAAQAPPRQGNPLLAKIDSVFLEQVRATLELTPNQSPRLERIVNQWAGRRLLLEQENQKLHQNLNAQLRPGVAGKPLRINQLVDMINANRVKYAESFRDEMTDLFPVLNPVQRGQFQLLRDQLQQRVRSVQQPRPGAGNIPPDGGGRGGKRLR